MVTTNHIQGAAVLRHFEQAAAESRRQAAELAAGLKELKATTEELVEQRGDALVDLAKHYLPEVTRESIRKTFAGVRDELTQVLREKTRRQNELRTEWDNLLDRRQQREIDLDSITEKLDQLVEKREQLEAVVSGQLAEDRQFVELSQEALQAEQELDRNEARVADIEREAAEKLPAYEEGRLFQYLYRRRFGTPDYKSKGWTRQLDRWVAGLIGYVDARKGYDFLRATPRLMADEVARRHEAFTRLMERVEEIEDRYSDETGLTEVLRDGETAGEKRDELLQAQREGQERAEGIEQELESLEGSENTFYGQAIDRLKEFLGSMEESALEARVRRTPEPQDDAIFAEIKSIGEQLDAAKERAATLGTEGESLGRRQTKFEGVIRRFRQAEFDSRRSHFSPGFDAQPLITDLLTGTTTDEDVWSVLRKHQEFAPSWFEQTTGGARVAVDSDISYVLLRALGEVAGQAMRNSARRGMTRRGPARGARRASAGRPRLRGRRGFTSGRGF